MKDDGGPAFPLSVPIAFQYANEGMTLRDWFAGQALNGMLAHATRYRPHEKDRGLHWHEAIAYEAYELADAMLAERDRK